MSEFFHTLLFVLLDLLTSIVLVMGLFTLYLQIKFNVRPKIPKYKNFQIPRYDKAIKDLLYKQNAWMLLYLALLVFVIAYYLNLGQSPQCTALSAGNYTISGTNTTKNILTNELNCTLNYGAISVGLAFTALAITLVIDWMYRSNVDMGKYDNIANITNSKINALVDRLPELNNLLKEQEFEAILVIIKLFDFSSSIYELDNNRLIINRLIKIQDNLDNFIIQIQLANNCTATQVEKKAQYIIKAEIHLKKIITLTSISGEDEKAKK